MGTFLLHGDCSSARRLGGEGDSLDVTILLNSSSLCSSRAFLVVKRWVTPGRSKAARIVGVEMDLSQ
jgi:hypothetical protein